MTWAMIALLIPSLVLRGFTLSQLWSWFFVPYGLPEVGIAAALGASLTVSFVTHPQTMSVDEEREKCGPVISILVSLMSLGFGYVYHLLA